MFKIGLSTTGKTIDLNLFKSYTKAGIECMEVSVRYDLYDTMDYPALRKMADATGVKLWSFHLPFTPFNVLDISASDSEWRKRSVTYISEIIKKAADVGFDKFILHSGGKTKRQIQQEVDERLNCACESYAFLAEFAEKCGAVICVENLPPVCVGKDIDEVEKLISADERLRICFDTNHLLPGDGAEFIRHFGEKIITMHVSDYDMVNERHWLPGEGAVNWQEIFTALKDVNYNGPWLYEIAYESPETLVRERLLTCDDYVRNAHEIFENREITIIPGTKKV